MLADKSKESPVEGLNQMFRINKNADNRTGITRKINSLAEIGGLSVLGRVPVDEILDDIESGKYLCYENLNFHESIKVFSEHYVEDKIFNNPVSWNCKGCEFTATPEEESAGKKSGYKECWSSQMGWKERE